MMNKKLFNNTVENAIDSKEFKKARKVALRARRLQDIKISKVETEEPMRNTLAIIAEAIALVRKVYSERDDNNARTCKG